MNDLSALGLHYLTRELQQAIDGKIDRVYNDAESKEGFLFAIHIPNKGKKYLDIALPSMIYLTQNKEQAETATGFCMMLRKYLEGGRIKNIAQYQFERVLEMLIERKEGRNILIIELFSKGNVILCDEKYTILNAHEFQRWKDREIKKGVKYRFPAARTNTPHMTQDEFTQLVKKSVKESIVKTLAIECSLGGTYAEAVCARASITKDTAPIELSGAEISKAYRALKELFEQQIQPYVCNGQAHPFLLEIHKKEPIERHETFSSALEHAAALEEHPKAKKKQEMINRLQHIIEEQEKNLLANEQEYTALQRKGELLYEQYQQIKAVMDAIKNIRAKHSWKEIKEKVSKDPKYAELIVEIDEKNNAIIIETDKL